MIPILFPQSETEFNNNGLGRLTDCLSCEVTEERNGVYECEFTYPVNGRHYNEIDVGYIIYCTHDESRIPQPFDIYKKSVPIDGVVTFNARHISYRLSNVMLEPFAASTCADAFTGFKNHSITKNPFTFSTDKTVNANFKVKTPVSVREMLGGTQGSILDVFGTGEYRFDKFKVYFNLHRGADKDVEIRYGKNLTDFENEIDYSEMYNAVVPYWYNEETGELVTLPEQIIVASGATTHRDYWTDDLYNRITDENLNLIEFDYAILQAVPMDLTEYFETAPTAEQIRARATSLLEGSEAWKPINNINVDFAALWQTPEYEDVAPLQRLRLCDTCKIVYPQAGINARAKIIRVVYDSLLDRYSKMELGDARQSFADVVRANTETQILDKVPTFDAMTAAVEHATQMIAGGLGGYVVISRDESGRPYEILIMDTPDRTTAVNVWRFNSGGLGHSSNGYDGPYPDIALTADGQINANLITTGTLSANRIRGGIIQALEDDGVSYWNIETGAFVTGDSERSLNIKNGAIYMYAPEIENYIGRISSFYWGNVADSDHAGFTILTNGKYFGLGHTGENALSYSDIVINNGLNPDGDTERIIFKDSVKIKTYLYISGNDPNNCGFLAGFNDGSGFAISTGTADRFILRANATNILGIDNGGYGHAGTAKYFPTKFYFKDAVIEQNTYTGNVVSIRLVTERLIVGNYSVMSGYKCRFESVYVDGALSAQSVTQRSDEHQKNISEWDDRYTALIDDLEPLTFTWKDGEDQKQHVGLGARHTKELLEKHGLENSGFVHVTAEDEHSIIYSELTVMLLKKVQEQQKTIDALEKRLERLELLLNANT